MKNRKSIFRYIHYILLTANAITILLLFLSVLAWWIPPSKTTLFSYLGLGFPFIVFANIAFVALWAILFKWKYLLAAFIPLLICFNPISTYFPVHSQSKDIPEDNIKFLTYNVRGFN